MAYNSSGYDYELSVKEFALGGIAAIREASLELSVQYGGITSKLAGRLGAYSSVVLGGADVMVELNNGNFDKAGIQVGGVFGALSGAVAGAKLGAIIGAPLGPGSAAVGAVFGSVFGGIYGEKAVEADFRPYGWRPSRSYRRHRQ